MAFNTSLRVGAVVTAFAVFVLPTTAAATRKEPHRLHHAHRAIYQAHTIYRGSTLEEGERLPPAPEYGFLSRVPPNAIRMPGYTFVPGRGIIGESCDLPTSACSNQYRDVQ